MFKLDIDQVRALHAVHHFTGPLLDAGGLEFPTIADYEISIRKAIDVEVTDDTGTTRTHRVPHSVQNDRYANIRRPWSFIDPDYLILNPDKGDPPIEALPAIYPNHFATVILVSVLEHCENPYLVSDALFQIVKPGGWLFNSTPFLFPLHPSPQDNWRFHPDTLRRIHEQSGFRWVAGGMHVDVSSAAGVGDSNKLNYLAPQAILAGYALCQKPL